MLRLPKGRAPWLTARYWVFNNRVEFTRPMRFPDRGTSSLVGRATAFVPGKGCTGALHRPTPKEETMGLFDFVKEIGHKLFNRDEEAAEKIKKHIEATNPGIDGLQVEYKNGVVSLTGQAKSAEAMEKAVLMAGNVQGVAEVDVSGLQAPPVEAKVEYYIIKKGDTLSAVAKQFYGKPNDYPRIFEANREVIKDANLIFPGQKIRIPLD
jgi:nucleoid-associated protein YgaU